MFCQGVNRRTQELFCKKSRIFCFYDFFLSEALFPIQVGKSFCYFYFKMAFRFLHCKNRNAAKRFGKKGWSLSCYVKRKRGALEKKVG